MMAGPLSMGSIRWTETDQEVERDCSNVKRDGMNALVLPSSTFTSWSGDRQPRQMITSVGLSTQHQSREPRLLGGCERLMSGIADRPGHKRDLSQYSHRLDTFEAGPQPWPRASPTPRYLARIGFYYTGYEHTVLCFLCEVEISEWDDGKDPLIKHYNQSPNCSFIHKEFSAELKRLISEERVAHQSPQYSSSSLRLHSFSNWLHSNVITSYQLASAGFFYTGRGSRVECFSCGLTHQDWKRGDLPLHVHRQQSPNCPFISSLLSKESVGSLVSVVPQQQQTAMPSDYPASRTPDYCSLNVRIRSFKHLAINFPVSGEKCAEAGLFFLRKPDVMKCFSCGAILRDWVDGDIPVEKHREVNSNCKFLCEYFPSKLSGLGEENEEVAEMGGVDPNTLPEPEFDEEDLERMSMVERAKCKQPDPSLEQVTENLSRVTVSKPMIVSDLSSEQPDDSGSMCVVCMDAPLEMVLIPCGHMCICEGCSRQIIACPMCRQTVEDALKVFFP